MSGIEGNGDAYLKLRNRRGEQIDLNAFKGGIEKNEKNTSVFEKFDIDQDGKLDEKEANTLKEFLLDHAGDNGILSKREVKSASIFGKSRKDVKNFYAGLRDMYSQQVAINEKAAQQQAVHAEQEPVEELPEEPVIEEIIEEPVEEETPPQQEEKPQNTQQNTSHQYKVNYKDTWYGIVQAKYGITDHKQTMEIVRQLKAHNNVNPKATNMPKEITLPDNITLKDGTEVKMTDIDAAVDQSHWGYKTTSKTGRYTITQNGKTRYYAADGTELKQSYFEAKEASPDKFKKSENGSGRYSYTAENGETWYFAADGTPIKEEYYNKRESEYSAVNAQKETVKNARAAFQQQLDSDGWAGKTADAVSVLWNSDNRAVKVEADLQAYENQIKDLQKAQSQGSTQFNAKFKEIFGVDYNPDNVAQYEANPTEENYKKAYGTKNDIHKRVMDYNKSQQEGAAAVKTTVVVAGSAAAAIATGGTSLIGTAAIVGGTTMAARAAAEVTDLATNNVEGDITGEKLDDIAEQAMIEGTIAGVTAGVFKGIGSVRGGKAPTGSGSTPPSETGLAKVPPKGSSPSSGEVVPVKTSTGSGTNTGASSGPKTGGTRTGSTGNTQNTGNTGSAKNTDASSGPKTDGTRSTGNTSNASSSTGNVSLETVKHISSKLSGRGGVSNLTSAERSQLQEIIGVPVENIAKMPKSQYRALQLKFHPDKNPNNQEFAQEIFSIISNIRSAA